MHLLITGATGTLGRPLCAELLRRGARLTVLSRQSPERVRARCGAAVDVWADLAAWTPEVAIDAVINLAGEPIADRRWTDARKAALRASRIALTEQLLQRLTAARHRPAVLLSGSAVGLYGDGGDRVFDEGAPRADDFAARLCADWEAAARQAEALGVRVVLLRTGLVLSREGGLLARMKLPFSLGLGARLGDGRQWMSWIHADDWQALVLRLLDDAQARGAYNLTAPEPVTNAGFTAGLAAALHRPAVFAAPAWGLKLALGEMAPLLLGGQRVRPERALAAGFTFRHPTLDGALRDLLG
jgi:uncharacterized protein (TIGR01777 family)